MNVLLHVMLFTPMHGVNKSVSLERTQNITRSIFARTLCEYEMRDEYPADVYPEARMPV
jgi:hypothetical protein